MKKQNMAWLGTLSFFTLLIAAFFSFSSASAENVSLWTSSGDITKTLVASDLQSNSTYFDASCTRQSAEELAYHASVSGWLPNGYAPVQGYCWQNAAFGTYGQGSYGQYLRFGTFGAVTRVDLSNQLIPIGNKLAMKYNNGSSYFSGLSVFDIPQKQFKLRTATTYGGVRNQYIIDASTNPLWTLSNPQTGGALSINAIGASNNGAWMVIEAGQSFIRLNVETKEILAFENPLYGYGGGTNPSFGLAISNDGRYTIIYGGGVNPQLFTVYDLSTCAPNPDNTMQTSVGCGKKDLRPSVFPGVSAYAGPSDVSFSDSAENISFNFNEAGKTNHYTITAPGHNQHLLQYLALGDSFSSGEGDGDGTWHYKAGTDGNGQTINNTGISSFPYWKEKCHISNRSYPYLLAQDANIGAGNYQSVACSGSLRNDVLNINSDSNYKNVYTGRFEQMEGINSVSQMINIKRNALENFIPGREAQIKFLEKYKPVVATIGIGGNDIDFSKKINACVAFAADTCDYASTNRHATGQEISDLYSKLKDIYEQLRKTSPTTRLYAIGYPQIVTSGGSCGVNVRLDPQEQSYTVFAIDYLNRTIRAAASASGISYLDIEDSLAGTNLCSSWGSPSVNGVTKGSDIPIEWNGLKTINVIGNESYHPNERGHALMASAIRTALSNEAINVHNPCTTSAETNCAIGDPNQPPIPAYFGIYSGQTPTTFKQFFTTVIDSANEAVVSMTDNAKNIAVNFADNSNPLQPLTDVQFTLHSAPTPLGTLQTDAEGRLSANITIPDGVAPGYHTVTARATLVSGDIVEFYQPLLVLASLMDGDGDGINDNVDPCPFVDASGIDSDHDGVDDSCDGFNNPDSTPPTLGSLTWTQNPKSTTQSTTLNIPALGDLSDIAEAEYFIGETDPGAGNGATMMINGDTLTTTFSTDFVTGVYRISVRAKDNAGNWSVSASDYLIVYDPTSSGLRMTGRRTITPSLSGGDILPGLIGADQTNEAKFGFSVKYNKNGQIAGSSDLQFKYKTGSHCNKPAKAINCHTLELNAASIIWLTTQGVNQSTGIFQGLGALEIDNISQLVVFRVTGIDGARLSPTAEDMFEIRIFENTADPNISTPLYKVNSTQLGRGNIRIL